MKNLKPFLVIFLMAVSFVSNAQNKQINPNESVNPTLIAVINSANWCSVCKSNGKRFGELINPYTSKGLTIYFNDLTNDTTKAASKLVLQKANVYEAVTTKPRKGMGHLLKSCGLEKDKKVSIQASGIVTFINPKTHKQLKQISIASTNEAMKSTIETLLNL